MADRNVTQAGPNARFNASVQPVGPAASRPTRGGAGSKRSFDVADLSNSALRKIQRPASLGQPEFGNAPFRQLGTPQQAPSSAMDLMMTGAGSSKMDSVARYKTGFGGMSDGAFAAVRGQLPAVPNADQMKMPGNKDIRFGQQGGNEYGVPYWAGFGAPESHEGIRMFRTGGINPTSRTRNGLMFNGFGELPTELNTQRNIHGVPNTDPRAGVPSLSGVGPNAPPLASAVVPSTSTPQALTEKKPYEDVNPIIQSHHMVRPLMPSFTPADHGAQFMVVHRSVASLNASPSAPRLFNGPAAAMTQGETHRYTEMSITEFNYLLASREVDPGPDGKEITARELWNNYELRGPVINESVLSTMDSAHRPKDQGAEHLVNIAGAGPASIFNCFGKKALQSNMKIAFVLKRVPRAQLAKLAQGHPFKAEARRAIREFQRKGSGASPEAALEARTELLSTDTLYYKLAKEKEYLTVYSRDPENRRLHPSPFQLVPYVWNSFAGVPLKHRRYTERDGSVAYGIVIEVGNTDYPLTAGRAEDGMAGMVDASRLADAGQLRIFTTVQTQHV